MQLIRRIRSSLAFRLARRLNRASVSLPGRWGRFRGRSDDSVMLGHYGRHGTWSAATVALFAQTANELVSREEDPPLLIDVGAAIGLVSLGVLAQAPGRALAIEACADTFQDLEHNVALNGMSARVETRLLAAGAPESIGRRVRMNQSPGNGGDSWISAECESDAGTAVVTLDELAEEFPDLPLLLKVDVQGYESQVLAGGKRTIERARLCIIEFWPYGLRRSGYDPEQFINDLVNDQRRIALLYDEHSVQDIEWISMEEAQTELRRLIAKGGPNDQLEIILGESNL